MYVFVPPELRSQTSLENIFSNSFVVKILNHSAARALKILPQYKKKSNT